MKKITFVGSLVLVLLCLSSVIFYQSCKKNLCKHVVCANNGTCDNGTCKCATGYEGESCTLLSRDKFLGSYSVAETCSSSGQSNYNITVSTLSTDVTKVLIYNFNKMNKS